MGLRYLMGNKLHRVSTVKPYRECSPLEQLTLVLDFRVSHLEPAQDPHSLTGLHAQLCAALSSQSL